MPKPGMKYSTLLRPSAGLTVIPSGSSPVVWFMDMCSSQQDDSIPAREENMLIVPHSLCLK